MLNYIVSILKKQSIQKEKLKKKEENKIIKELKSFNNIETVKFRK